MHAFAPNIIIWLFLKDFFEEKTTNEFVSK